MTLIITDYLCPMAGCQRNDWKMEETDMKDVDWSQDIKSSTMSSKFHWHNSAHWMEGQKSIRSLLPSNKERNKSVKIKN